MENAPTTSQTVWSVVTAVRNVEGIRSVCEECGGRRSPLCDHDWAGEALDGPPVTIKLGCPLGVGVDPDFPDGGGLACACPGICYQRVTVPQRYALFHILAQDLTWATHDGTLGVREDLRALAYEQRQERRRGR
jgi:hypothetical protein